MRKNLVFKAVCAILAVSVLLAAGTLPFSASTAPPDKKYIKWIDFTVTNAAMRDALKADEQSYGTDCHVPWTEILAYLAAKNGGNFKGYKSAHTAKLLESVKGGQTVNELAKDLKNYAYYLEAYTAVLGGLVGRYTEVKVAADGSQTREEKYGLRAFSPIADGYYYTHYDDFGDSRSFGYRRNHLGHDLLGSIGTPIIAIESGYVEHSGWNRFGGWRIGIRSFDGKRYYYYAHLRKGHPYNDIYDGKIVNAGEVIGYLGMTGYSSKPDTNNIDVPHLHFGLQIIFDKSQIDGTNQIWIDMYHLTNFLSAERARTYYDSAKKERFSRIYYEFEGTPD